MPVPLPALAVGAGVGLAAIAVGLGARPGRGLARRARALGRPSAATARADTPRGRAAGLAGWLERVAPVPVPRAPLRAAARAGLRGPDLAAQIRLTLVVGPLIGLALGWVAAPALGFGAVRGGAVLAGLALGLVAPALWLANAIGKREAALRRQLPDALDLHVICAEAGLGLDPAMARVARELHRAAPVIADELAQTALELGFLPDRADAFANLAARAGVPEMRAFVGVIRQTEQFGTPLAAALRTLSSEVRTAQQLRAEARAARLPAVLTVPMILFVLPPLFVVLGGPAVLQLVASS